MMMLSDCVLAIDGERIGLSRPTRLPGTAKSPNRLSFGVAARDCDRARQLVGRTGIVHTQSGVVLMRLKIHEVDPTLHVLTGEPATS